MIDPRNPDYTDSPASARRPTFHYSPASLTSPQVSVITPYFNADASFLQTAAAILSQSLQNFEWIIVDDGSTDQDSIHQLQFCTDPRIRIIRHDGNQGLPAARNTGFKAARSDLIFQIDTDDLIEPTTLEQCAWFLRSFPEAAFVKGFTVGFGAQHYLWTKGFHDGAAMRDENLVTATAMVRKSAWERVGGYDTTLREGMEDWDFWLRCAAAGLWGATIPQFLDWYRRRGRADRPWTNISDPKRRNAFIARLKGSHPQLFSNAFPHVNPRKPDPARAGLDPDDGCILNPLAKEARRLLIIVPWLAMGGADRFNINFVERLTSRGWEVTIATTLPGDHSWLPDFSRLTPDIFCTTHFLRPELTPRFLRAIIESRRPDAVLITNSEMGYELLPYLRFHCPAPAYLDYCHMEEPEWRNGGYPADAVRFQPLLDLNIVASEHLKRWEVSRGGDAGRIEVCRINVDTEAFHPDQALRDSVRAELGLAANETVILHAARICPQKRPATVAAVAAELARRGHRFTMLIAGDGPDLPWLKESINRDRLTSQVQLLGAIPAARMRQVLAASDIFFLPSKWEGIAMALYEAMSMGLVVVSADVGGQSELVTPESGILLPPGQGATPDTAEVERYAAALADLIVNPDHRSKLAAAARARVLEHFGLQQMADRMEEILHRAVQLHKGGLRSAPDPTTALQAAQEAVASALAWRRPGTVSDPFAGGGQLDLQIRAQIELGQIERSLAWRILGRLASTDHASDAVERLRRIHRSATYRLIASVKDSFPYLAYKKRKPRRN